MEHKKHNPDMIPLDRVPQDNEDVMFNMYTTRQMFGAVKLVNMMKKAIQRKLKTGLLLASGEDRTGCQDGLRNLAASQEEFKSQSLDHTLEPAQGGTLASPEKVMSSDQRTDVKHPQSSLSSIAAPKVDTAGSDAMKESVSAMDGNKKMASDL